MLELLIVLSILFVLFLASLPFVLNLFHRQADLTNSVESVIEALRLAENKTLASEGQGHWGLYFSTSTSPNQFILFKGETYAGRASSSDETYFLPPSIFFKDIDLGGKKEIVFERVSGEILGLSGSGKVILSLKSDVSKTKTLFIEGNGRIGLTQPISYSDNNRIKDSRHTHFDLGWSIQNSSTLKFYFPRVSRTENVLMASYFNPSKTDFDYDNTANPFVINGKNQAFRVHTHVLDAFNTLVSISRSRKDGMNNEEVYVYIVDGGINKEIAHYLGDQGDSVQKGIYVSTMEKQ